MSGAQIRDRRSSGFLDKSQLLPGRRVRGDTGAAL